MVYHSLARKYRPYSFADLIAQDATATALKNSIKLGRPPQAVLFSGIRGVGKTTCARLYAKALNCLASNDGDPCGNCDNCIPINEGRHLDIVEIDGASHTGVDDVRQLQETLQYKPQKAKYKIYLIDEVHMLSISAFNALLKSLEEPPAHVVFIFATTELKKVPQTILSRCQIFHLKKIPLPAIVDRLQMILKKEQVAFDQRALEVIAIEGQGSMRDALTLLDQVIALGNGEVRDRLISDFFPAHSFEAYFQLLNAIVTKDKVKITQLIDEFDQTGLRFIRVVEETAKLARHCFLFRDIGENSIKGQILGLSAGDLHHFDQISKKAPHLDLNRIFRTLIKCREDLDGSSIDRFIVENYLLEWCLDPGLPFHTIDQSQSTRPLKQNTSAIEKTPNQGSLNEVQPTNRPSPPPKRFPETWRALVELWKKEKPLQARKLEEVHPIKYSEEEIILAVDPNQLAASTLLNGVAQKQMCDDFALLFGFKGKITFKNIQAKQEHPLPTTILETKQQERLQRDAQINEEVKSHSLIQSLIQEFDGKIARIDIKE